MLKRKTTVLILCPYPLGLAASQRFRFEQYFDLMTKKGFEFNVKPFLTEDSWGIIYKSGNFSKKILGLFSGFLSRWIILFQMDRFDFVFIHREAAPIGPPFFEWVIAKIFRKKIIYDFDDAIWLPNTSPENNLAALVRWQSKVKLICGWSHKISVGNKYLGDFARQFSPSVYTNPTTIDTINLHNPDRYSIKQYDKIVIGWTGTHSTLKYLSVIEPVFESLYTKFQNKIELRIIADRPPELRIPFQFVVWSKATEIEDLMQFHIGIMPLTDDRWAKGKCGFKALQYMALQIPSIASPVGVNAEIIENGKDGFLCQSLGEWEFALITLIENKKLRESIGNAARKKVTDHYSFSSNSSNFVSLFS
jgi:glycosyltransferase involved in cell wall biosynthesis